jgi:hypothetical protein
MNKKTRKQKVEILTIVKGYAENSPVNGIEQLQELKKETIKRWKKSGLLEGLKPSTIENLAALYESQESFIISEDPSQIVDN